MTDWNDLSFRAGVACHDIVGWMMWDERAKASFADLGMPNTDAWVVAWRLAALGDTPPAVIASMTYSINPTIIDLVSSTVRSLMTHEQVLAALDDAVMPGLESIAPGLAAELGELADDLWRGVDSVFHGMRPFFVAHRALPRPADRDAGLSAWHAINCIRELRGDNHWALLASEGIDDVEAGLLHSAMIDVDEYGSEEWIARSRGGSDEAVSAAWARLESRGFANGGSLTDDGRTFRRDIERRTDELTAPVWREIGEPVTERFLDLVAPHHSAFVARINETAGPNWMPAVRGRGPG
ncbi:MAG: hypothetical protein AAGC53_20195 [Actinomycetota bacterium]